MRTVRFSLALLLSILLLGAGASQLAVSADENTAPAFKNEQVALRIVPEGAECQFHCSHNLHGACLGADTRNRNTSKLGRPLWLPGSEPSSPTMLNRAANFARAWSWK